MKKQTKLNIKVRDLEPLKDVIAGRRRHAIAPIATLRAFRALRVENRGGLGPCRTTTGFHNEHGENRTWSYPTLRFLI